MNNRHNLNPQALTRSVLAGILLYFAASPSSAHAGVLCNWLGIGCDPVSVMGRSADDDGPAATRIDQNNPPQVFAFTISGKFDQWTDIPEEVFICDTRKRDDRACVWQGHIDEIKRRPTFVFKPYAHDLGMYNVEGFIANNFGEDPDYSVRIGIDAPEFQEAPGVLVGIQDGISITHLAKYPLQAKVYEAGRYKLNKREAPYGTLSVVFKEVLK